MDLRKLKINGFHLSYSCEDKLHSIFYDSDEDLDDFYITITEDTEEPDTLIVSITKNGEQVVLTTFTSKNIDELETWLSFKTSSIKE